MNKFASRWGTLAAFLLVTGCAMEMGGGVSSGVSVTRFHLGQPIARGPIAVEAASPAEAGRLQFDRISGSVERELARLGGTVQARTGATEQVAIVRVDQAERAGRRGGGVSIGLGVG